VVLKREPLGSLWEEFFIPGRKFVLGSNWGGKAADDKTLSFIISLFNTYKNCTVGLVQIGMSTARKHKLLHQHHRLSQFFQSTTWPH